MMLSFLHCWDYCWKCESDTDVEIENYNHCDGEQLHFLKKGHILTHSKKKGHLWTSALEPRHWNWNWNWTWNWFYKRHYFQFHKAYGYQIWQGVDLGWGDPTHKVTWHFDIVVMWQIKSVISPLSQGLWTPNLSLWWLRMKEPHLRSHVTHHHVVTWQIKNIISLLSQGLWTPNLANW